MKVFLLQSYLGRREKPIYPVGLAYLAACLADHELQACDPNVASDPYGDLAERLRRFQPELVGISLRNVDTTNYRDPFVYLQTLQPTLDLIAKAAPKALRVIGGAGFSIFAQPIMERFRDLDFGFLLEAEESFPAFLANPEHPENVPGIYYRADGEVRLSAPARLPDFDALPSPRWDVVDLEPYKREFEAIGVQAKRGCGLRCAYCTYYFLNGARYRLRAPEKIVAEIVDLRDRFKISHFMFLDSIFNIPPQHAEEICREILRQKLNLPWSAWYNEKVFSEDFFKLAKEAGCRDFSFSPDAYSDRSLERLQKNLRVKDVRKVFDLARNQQGARFGYNFFVNPPAQTYWDFVRLMLFWLRVRFELRGKLYGFGLGNIRVEPDTRIYEIAREEGVIPEYANLLPETSAELSRLFYTNPKTPLINTVFKGYDLLARIKHRLQP